MTVSLLFSTYNYPGALRLLLSSIKIQRRRPDQILIADDGSTDKTREIIDAFRTETGMNVIHAWQPDDGFRKSIVLNKALAQCTSDYVVQIDGDCIMHPRFIEDHCDHAVSNGFLYGSRSHINEANVQRVIQEGQFRFGFFAKGLTKRTRNLWIPTLARRNKPEDRVSSKLRGCNMSYWYKDAVAVNGYDETFTGWGNEDSEFAHRLFNIGVLPKRLRYAGIIYHLWHRERNKNTREANAALEAITIENKRKWAEQGLNQHTS